MRRSLTALIAVGITVLSLATGATAASAAPNAAAGPQDFALVIDQFATSGPGGQSDQYIQIQNISQAARTLSGFSVDAWLSQSVRALSVTIPVGVTLYQNDVYVIANADAFSGPPGVVNQYWSGIALPSRLGLCLMGPTNARVDAVATTPGTPCQMGATPAAAQPPGNAPDAVVRHSNTGDNGRDFHIGFRTPGTPSHVDPF
ncbi:hypothetical protein BCF44_1284 [Kutzneria buriramensis]|uniref:Lamin tail-like protein n=2 Tax=Kutzneria buriramensis TaxID=1045776 RepID=A0A3E0GW15_9PSEU|nr:hypothetical protein BCF44_1284 [Kutzneria buriramensis]